MSRGDIDEYTTLVINDRPVMVTHIGDRDSLKRSASDTIYYSHIEGDGSLGRPGHISPWEVENGLKNGKVQYLDGARVNIKVELPEKWAERAKTLQAAAEAAAAEWKEEQGESELVHPSFGNITLHRASGDVSLYGSPFKHSNFISISVRRSTKRRSLSHRWDFGDGPELLEIWLSEAQFASFITSMASGQGTPCTLSRVFGNSMPAAPAEKEVEEFHEDFEKTVALGKTKLGKALAMAKGMVDKKGTISMQERKELVGLIESIEKIFEDHVPFVVNQFDDRMEKIVSAGKHEVEAFINNLAHRLGLDALKNAPIKFLAPASTNICAECGQSVSEDDTVWIDPVTTKATMTGKPYHVGCAPAQKE